jgi:hypothetical protein
MTRGPFLRLVALAVVMASCSPGPTASPSPTTAPPSPSPSAEPSASVGPSADADATYRAIAAQVVAIRGLDAPDRVEPAIIDRPTLEKNLAAEFDKDNPQAEIAKGEAIEKILGLLPADASLRDLYVKLQGSQVIGYYDPTAKKLFIVSDRGGLGPVERLTYAHEFTHELQDRHFDLNGLGLKELHDDSDRGLAILSLVEGDAVNVQTAWMLQNLTPAELGQVAAEASDPAMLAVLASMPPILLETSLFPYQAGATFVAGLMADGSHEAVDAAFGRPPASTEQILHPEKYTAGEAPVAVVLPDDLAVRFGTGWTEYATDTMGELQMRVWLKQGGVPGDAARAAAEGWGGDRMVLVKGPDGSNVLVFESAWDLGADADAFLAAASTALAGLGLDGEVVESGSRVVIGIRSGTAPAGAALRSILDGLANPNQH